MDKYILYIRSDYGWEKLLVIRVSHENITLILELCHT